LALTSLHSGQQLQLGSVLLQLTKECSPCRRMDDIRAGLQEMLRGRRGMLARVLRGGTIRLGEAVNVV
ncbi:MAG: MOSC domain-containing protein, partial [Bacteroidota bacterium]